VAQVAAVVPVVAAVAIGQVAHVASVVLARYERDKRAVARGDSAGAYWAWLKNC
jgi:hypothetical protein